MFGPLKFREIAGNLPLSGDSLFRSLTTDGGSPHVASLRLLPRACFGPEFGQLLFAIIYGSESFLGTGGISGIAGRLREIPYSEL